MGRGAGASVAGMSTTAAARTTGDRDTRIPASGIWPTTASSSSRDEPARATPTPDLVLLGDEDALERGAPGRR